MKKIIFMGTPDFAVPILESLIAANYELVLVVTQPDRKVGRKQRLQSPPVKVAAEKHKIPVLQPDRIRLDYESILQYEADLIVTAAYGQILPNEILQYPSYGCINVHASLLPELRGGAPIHYAILQGKKKTGITIMYMVEQLDAGDMIAQSEVPITLDDTVGSLHDKLQVSGAELLIETLPAIFARTNDRIPQDESLATFAPNISREQEKIIWSKSHLDIYNQIRGPNPWPVAYAEYNGSRIKLWRANLSQMDAHNGKAGEIIAINPEGSITIACGNQKCIELIEIQIAGKKRIDVKQFLRGNPDYFQIGEMLE